MSDSVVRQFSIDLERHRAVIESLIKHSKGNTVVLAVLCGCMIINGIERRLLERELKALKVKVNKSEAIDV